MKGCDIMLAQERQAEILNLLMQRGGIVKMTEIARKFGVSNETVRRDLELLQEQQLIQRVYGGAVLAGRQNASSSRAIFSATRAKGQQERQAIGRTAAALVHENETLLLGTGTTVLEVAKNLKHLRHLTVLTNSLPVAQELADTGFDIYLLGGKLDSGEMFTVGEMGLSALQHYFVDRTIIGAAGVTFEYGISSFNTEDYTMSAEILRRSNQVILVAASEKFGRNGFCVRDTLEHVDIVVCDESLPAEYVDGFRERGTELILAPL